MLNEIKPKKGDDPKVICDKNEALKVKYQDHAYKSELMQAQVEAEVNNMDIMYKNFKRCINDAWRIKFGNEGVMLVEEVEAALTNTGFKEKCHLCGKYGHKQNKCPKKNKPRKGKETRNFLVHAITVVSWGASLQTTGNMNSVKTRGQRIGRRKKTWRLELQTLRSCWNVLELVQSNLNLTRFCLKLICGNLHLKNIRYQYTVIHLMIAKIM